MDEEIEHYLRNYLGYTDTTIRLIKMVESKLEKKKKARDSPSP